MAWRCCNASERSSAPLCAHAHDRGARTASGRDRRERGEGLSIIEKAFDANTLVETVKEALSNHHRLTSMLQNQREAGSAQGAAS